MEFRYIIPKHIQGYLEDIPEDKLNSVMTFMFELAIKHNLINEESLDCEKGYNEVLQSLEQMNESRTVDTNRILESLSALAAKLESIETVATPRAVQVLSTVNEAEHDVQIVLGMNKERPVDNEIAATSLGDDERLEAEFLEDMLK